MVEGCIFEAWTLGWGLRRFKKILEYVLRKFYMSGFWKCHQQFFLSSVLALIEPFSKAPLDIYKNFQIITNPQKSCFLCFNCSQALSLP